MPASMRRAIVSTLIALVAASPLASTGLAGVRPDDRADRTIVPPHPTPSRPDDRANRLVTSGNARTEPHLIPAVPDNRAVPRGPGAFDSNPPTVIAGDVFDWDDAVLGAAFAICSLLLASGALTLRRRVRLAH